LSGARSCCAACRSRAHASSRLLTSAGVRDYVYRAHLQSAVRALRTGDFHLVSIVRFQRAVVAVYVDRLAVIGSKSPVAASLFQAATHRGLLA